MFYDELIKKANSNDSNKQTKKRRRRLDMLIKSYLIPVNLLQFMNLID